MAAHGWAAAEGRRCCCSAVRDNSSRGKQAPDCSRRPARLRLCAAFYQQPSWMRLPSTPRAPGRTLTSASTALLQILETKVRKLEQLVKLKDAKIATLAAKLQAAGLM
jgi:hypothetical protein